MAQQRELSWLGSPPPNTHISKANIDFSDFAPTVSTSRKSPFEKVCFRETAVWPQQLLNLRLSFQVGVPGSWTNRPGRSGTRRCTRSSSSGITLSVTSAATLPSPTSRTSHKKNSRRRRRRQCRTTRRRHLQFATRLTMSWWISQRRIKKGAS